MDRTSKRRSELSTELEQLYRKYHRVELLADDPLGLVNGNLSSNDFELVSFISASLSYGRVEQIRKSLIVLWKNLEKLSLGEGGRGLHALLVDNSGKTLKRELQLGLKGWVHRFNDAEDISVLILNFQKLLKDYKNLGEVYADIPIETSPTKRLEIFVESLRSYSKGRDLELLKWFTCSPAEGSTCKRMVMWLRWMLRSDDIDPGLWSRAYSKFGIGAHLAFIPMDTHVHRWAMQRGLLTRKSPSWKSVEELTGVLRGIDPRDPARFDFSICHSGMSRFREELKTV